MDEVFRSARTPPGSRAPRPFSSLVAIAVAWCAGWAAGADREPTPAPPQPASRSLRVIEGWTLRVDDRLLAGGVDAAIGAEALRCIAAKLADIRTVVPAARLADLRAVPIVLDVRCGDLRSMQYHPGAEWLTGHGYPADLARCVHLPVAADVATPRNIREQPWVLLHELAHAYHDRVLGFDEPRIRAAFERFVAGGRGERTLLYDGSRTRHYALTDHKEFFAEMTEAWFGSNDFHPFNRAELLETEPEIAALMDAVWGVPAN
ncbi:MAG: metallopeptidase [Planctomycetia bacterium]|nr:metallopeptidase [Planctomycetia bacterium]